MVRVLVADDQKAVRSALRRLLNEEPGLTVVGEVCRADELLDQAIVAQPDLVLLDWELPGLTSTDGSESISLGCEQHTRHRLLLILHALHSHPKVIVLSGRPGASQTALAAGADAFVSKGDPAERLLTTVQVIGGDAGMI
jgi:DNA-binding NarL/FixJ family response regulator